MPTSRGTTRRLFIWNTNFRTHQPTIYKLVLWKNLSSRNNTTTSPSSWAPGDQTLQTKLWTGGIQRNLPATTEPLWLPPFCSLLLHSHPAAGLSSFPTGRLYQLGGEYAIIVNTSPTNVQAKHIICSWKRPHLSMADLKPLQHVWPL